MAYTEDVNVNLNVLAGTMGGITAIMGGMSALTSSFGSIATTASDSFGVLDGLLVSSTALITTFAVQSAAAFGEFEQGMKVVQAVSGQGGAAINELTDRANEMSVAYRTSIGDITDGLQTLGRAGLNSVNEQLEVLESGLQTAKLEGRNLNGVLEELIQNTAMLGGDLKSINFGEQTEYLNSLLVGTSMTAPITSHDISQTLQYAGGTAAAAGANLEDKEKLEDLMGTIAAFAQKGVTGSMAGTALRAFFTKPASQDKSVTEGLASIGLTADDLWEDGGNKMKDVSDQIGIIQRQMEKLNLSTMDQVEVWGKIVGPKMGQQMMKLDSQSIKELTRDIQNAQSAEDLATQTLQTYNQKLSEMQKQGEIAYREFGEKAAAWLLLPVEGITKLLELLSNPVINTSVFIVTGSLISHGIRKIWNMATTAISQVRGLLGEVAMGIQNINSLAGGSVGGFAQSTSQVDFLNSKLRETDATLQAIQAKSLGIRPGYIMPGSHGSMISDQVDRGVLKAYEENVVYGGVYQAAGFTEMEGKLYSGDQANKLISEATTINEKNQELQKKALAINDENLKQQEHYTKAAHEVYQERIKEIEKDVDYWRRQGIAPQFKRAMDKETVKISNLFKDGAISVAQRDEAITALYDKYVNKTAKLGITPQIWGNEQRESAAFIRDSTIKGLPSMFPTLSEEKINEMYPVFNEKELNKLAKEAERTVQTQLKWMRTGEADKWMRNYNINDDVARYSRERTQELWDKEDKAISKYRDKGWVPVMQSRAIQDTHPNSELFYQGENSGLNKAYIEAREKVQNQMRNRMAGVSGLGASAKDFGAQRLQQWSDRASKGLSGFTSTLSTAKQKIAIFHNGIEQMAPQLTQKAIGAFEGIRAEATSVEEGLAMLMKETNLNAVEFEALWKSSTVLQERFTALINATLGQEGATKGEISAIIEDISARRVEAKQIEGGIISRAASKAGDAINSVVGMMGGPFMAAMMGATVIMQAYQGAVQAWQEKVQDASNQISEAADKLSSATEKIQDIYKDENGQISDAMLDKATDEQYASIYSASMMHPDSFRSGVGNAEVQNEVDMSYNSEEDRMLTEEEIAERQEAVDSITLAKDENVKALNENTVALVSATNAYQQALGSEADAYNDGIFGYNGTFSQFADGQVPTTWEGILTGIFGGYIYAAYQYVAMKSDKTGFLDNKTPVLTPSQKDKNYVGSTEFAPIFAADIAKFGFQQGLEQFFGSDYDRIITLMSSMDKKIGINNEAMGGYSALASSAANIKGMDQDSMALAQVMMKENKDDFQKLGKQMFRYEQQYGFDPNRTAMRDYSLLSQGIKPSKDYNPAREELSKMGRGFGVKDLTKGLHKGVVQGLKNAKLTVTDRNLQRTVRKIMELSDGKLTEANVLAMGQLQQLQDMYQIANESISPGINQTVQGVMDNVTATGIAGTNAGNASQGAYGAAQNAAVIAAFLGAQAQETAEHAEYTRLQREGYSFASEDEFREKLGRGELPRAEREIYESLAGTGWSLYHPGASPDMIAQNAERLAGANSDLAKSTASYQDKLNTATSLIVNYGQGAVLAQYSQSNLGEYGGGTDTPSAGSDGGGDGDGDSGSDSGSGTKKSRVDLVLCNKKEIPKLNVNLFKKPPNFTILNKNFKLRDIKINSQDKPKAIMNAIKNGIIETQKRMDPKIIQDEDAVYDPVAATDGTSTTPSGTTRTTT